MLQIYRVSSHKVQFLNLNTKTKLAKNTEMTQCEAVSVCFESSDWLIFEFGATSLQPMSIGPGNKSVENQGSEKLCITPVVCHPYQEVPQNPTSALAAHF